MKTAVLWSCLLAGVLATGLIAQETPSKEASEAAAAEQPAAFQELQPARLTFGARAWEEGVVESIGDILLPVYATRSGLLFVNPRGSWRGDESEMNLGAGYRQLLGGRRMIAGVNAYYDRRHTDNNNRFHQYGAGVEFLSDWVDARANYYLPDDDIETFTRTVEGDSYDYTARDFDWNAPYGSGNSAVQPGVRTESTIRANPYTRYTYQEQAMEGFDCELGFRLPIPVLKDWSDVRLFAGWYSFDNDLSSTVEGWKGRLEVRALPALLLDAEMFEDDDLNGSDYYIGARFQIPFDIGAWAAGRNPFAGALAGFKPARRNAEQSFDVRLTEMVMRDPRIQTQVTEAVDPVPFIIEEVLAHTEKRVVEVLADSLIYVDKDNDTGIEDGTWEHPYNTIAEGLAAASGDMDTVYVLDSAKPYRENLVIEQDGITLIGSGSGIAANGGFRFATGIHPVLQGRAIPTPNPTKNDDPFGTLTIMADDVTVSGLAFRGVVMDTLLAAIRDGILNPNKDVDPSILFELAEEAIRYSGILAIDANNLLIEDNIFYGHSIGVLALFGTVAAAKIPEDPHAEHMIVVRDNVFEKNLAGFLGVGIGGLADISKIEPDPVPSMMALEGNTFLDNLLGAGVLQIGGGLALVMRDNTFVTDLLPVGVGALAVNVDGPMLAYIVGNRIEGNHTIGLGLFQEYGSLDAVIANNTISGCQLASLAVDANSLEGLIAMIEDRYDYVKTPVVHPWDVNVSLIGNTIAGNGSPIDLTDWLPEDEKEEIDPLIRLPDCPSTLIALTGRNVQLDLEGNVFSGNRGGALLAALVADQELVVNVNNTTGSGNGGLFQRNDPDLGWEENFEGMGAMTDYSLLILGESRGTIDSTWSGNVFTGSRLLAMFLQESDF